MFGYVTANRELLSAEAQKRYRGCYCGLCKTLRDRYKLAGQMTLTYDMTFLVLLLSSLYEPEEEQGLERCPVHPFKTQAFWKNPIMAYGADMNVLLAYYKCVDDWKDDQNLLKWAQSGWLKAGCTQVEQAYPRQSAAVREGIVRLSAIEAAKRCDPDMAANCFAAMMGELFVYRTDRWEPALRTMGEALGRYIYLMDAYEDVETDRKRKRYNPFEDIALEENFQKHCLDILTMVLGECTDPFEALPLVRDVEILRNILYSGVWMRFAAITGKNRSKKGTAKDGSI